RSVEVDGAGRVGAGRGVVDVEEDAVIAVVREQTAVGDVRSRRAADLERRRRGVDGVARAEGHRSRLASDRDAATAAADRAGVRRTVAEVVGTGAGADVDAGRCTARGHVTAEG